MRWYKNENADSIILQRSDELMTSLETYATENNLAGAWLQSGLGGAGSVTLSFYDFESRQYLDKVFTEPLEIVSLQGNLAWVDSKPFWHVHGIFGTEDYSTIGGHIKNLEIALTGELLVMPLRTAMTRVYDETTGLKLLQ